MRGGDLFASHEEAVQCAGAGVMYDMYVCAGLLSHVWLLFSDNIIDTDIVHRIA